jgi:phi13 family phage major tail protein
MPAQIGLSDLYYALLTTDAVDATPVYATPVHIAGAISAKINPNTDNATLFADNGPQEVATALGAIDLELNVVDLELPVQAALLGHTYSANGILKRKGSDTPPWVAIGFKSLKSNGKYRFTWLTKGKFAAPEQANDTKNDKVNFQTPTIKGSFVKRDWDSEWERHIDEDDTAYDSSVGTSWFTAVNQS